MSRRRGFFWRMLGRNADEDETRTYQLEEIGKRIHRPEGPEEEPAQGITVERAARLIDDLPPEVTRESAVRIMRGTLAAAGVEVEDIEKSARAREARLDSEIELARSRQDELRRRTEELVRSLQEEIRKAREARDVGIAEEEGNISRAERGLEEVRRVRAFFDFPDAGGSLGPAGDSTGDETQVLEPLDSDGTQVMHQHSDPRGDATEPVERPSTPGTNEER
ncbi:MAG: hypothetical protein M3N18_00635 [Actinomycetota bacterium]|nr:hypothetical protein [Actinomycetota bacterium]